MLRYLMVEDNKQENWWDGRREQHKRAAGFIRTLDPAIQSALLLNPTTSLLVAAAQAGGTDTACIRRASASLRDPVSFFHFVYYKPRGLMCQPNQRLRENEQSVSGKLPIGFPAVPFGGRLDAETEGLLFFSDDGRLLNALFDPSAALRHVSKTYFVQVKPPPAAAIVASRHDQGARALCGEQWSVAGAVVGMREPIIIKGSVTEPAEVELCESCPPHLAIASSTSIGFDGASVSSIIDNSNNRNDSEESLWLAVTIREGKNRQIRRLCKRARFLVLRLVRTDLGPLSVRGITPGEAKALSRTEVEAVYHMAFGVEHAQTPESLNCPVEPKGDCLIHLVPTVGQV